MAEISTSYTTKSNKLKITELDFDAIKDSLKTYLAGQTVFKDYDFEGSAMNILLDILSYNTHYNGFYANMLASEMFMDSASLRSSVVSLAKHLGYTPASIRGATVKVDVEFSGISGLTNILIPQKSKFYTKIGRSTFTFLSTDPYTASLDNISGSYVAKDIEIKEGVSFAIARTSTGRENEVFVIPNEDVDTTTLQVAVGGEVYAIAEDYTEITSTSRVYFLQEGRDNLYEIYFGDDVIGKKPEKDDVVEIGYSVSQLGSGGNALRLFTFGERLSGISSGEINVTLSSGYIRSMGGAAREDISTIRIQAPRQYALQKRVVTAQDYKARLLNDYNIVESVRVWGGEDNIPPQYGKVFISVKPKTGYVLSNNEKKRVVNEILKKRGIIGVTPEFVDPDYLFVVPNISFAYDQRKTTRKSDELISLVKTVVSEYSSSKLGKFDEYFKQSVMSRKIDDAEISIVSNNSDIMIKKRIRPILGISGNYRIFFDNKLYRPHVNHRNVLTSTMFTYNDQERCSLIDINGVLKIVQADKAIHPIPTYMRGRRPGAAGNLVINVNDEYTLEKALADTAYNLTNEYGKEIVGDIGRVNYSTGEVWITKFMPTKILNMSNYIYVSVKPNQQDIMPMGNTIVTIEPEDVTVTAIEEFDRLDQLKTQSY